MERDLLINKMEYIVSLYFNNPLYRIDITMYFRLKELFDKYLDDNFDTSSTYEKTKSMTYFELKNELYNLYERFHLTYGHIDDVFYAACLLLRAYSFQNELVNLDKTESFLKYKNIDNDSNVDKYSIGEKYIAVTFYNTPYIYVYTTDKIGVLAVEILKHYAEGGNHLGKTVKRFYKSNAYFYKTSMHSW